MRSAYGNIEEVQEALMAARNNDLYDRLWEVRYRFKTLSSDFSNKCQVSSNNDCLSLQDMTELNGRELQKPRVTGKQTLRANHVTETDKEFFRVSLFNPYLDHLIAELTRRFESSPSTADGEIFQ